jgi:hypothetical protein
MKRAAWLVAAAGLAVPGMAMAAVDCGNLPTSGATAQRVTVLAPLALELTAPSYMLGANSGVLGHAYDESQTVDEVLVRRRIEGCRNVAFAPPASVADPDDPAAYKPKTEFDNTPWRFDMNQNGRRMTADEFDAWMKARGVRVARGSAPAAAAATPVADGTPAVAPVKGEPEPAPQPEPVPADDIEPRR